ncbi:Pre-rRNA-processing protein ESF2 [Massariosphaeria phaeospora]|uniref:18S rRNA factor 2 n=1 Tax=Massariosphaeria phaeospora TaxID=100035 RepID=A0A7C8MC99_9PLEO|nr:Pre-rRNA-processing protein ESF2 [Massariosphaeria phaeospora]
MVTRKRNEWLDADESDEDGRGYDSEDQGRARTLPSSKRQKHQHEFEDESEAADSLKEQGGHDLEDEDEGSEHDYEDDDIADASRLKELARLEKLAASLPSDLKLAPTPLTPSQPLSTAPKKDKSGVVYLSRVPPFMKPAVLRSLLTPYGAISRIFLTPESSTARTARLRSGGTRRKLYLDGWVEFAHKRDAKFVAAALNAQTMGGKKRSRWHDEVWNVKYLSGVKWAHLVEQIQNENAERAARLRSEIALGKKENQRFLDNVERGKMIGGIEAKRKRKVEDGGEEVLVGVAEEGKRARRKMDFRQREVRVKGDKKPEPGQDVQRVISKIF